MSSIEEKCVYIVAGSKPWNRRVFEEVINKLPGKWRVLSSPQGLTLDSVKRINPRYIFSLHWSWKVLDEIITIGR